MEKQASYISSQMSQILNNNEKCFVCKGIEEPSIVIFSSLPKEKNFVKLICNLCLKTQEHKQKKDSFDENTISVQGNDNKNNLIQSHEQDQQEKNKESQQSQQLFNDSFNENKSSSNSELLRDSSIKSENQEQKKLSQISENTSQNISQLQTCDCALINDKDSLTIQIKGQNIFTSSLLKENNSQFQNDQAVKDLSQVSQDQGEDDKEKEILEQQNLEKQKSIELQPAFLIQPHHVQISFDQLISQLESSLKTQKFELLQKSTELQIFIKSSLRVIYDIQSEVENLHSSINEVSSKPEGIIHQLRETNFSQDKQSLLEQLIQYIDLNKKNVEAKLKQFDFQEKIDDIQTKLEYLSESLQPNLFKLNSQIYKVKKETVEQCNFMLSMLAIQGKWKQYSDIKMDEEIMHPGMRGVYRYTISQNGRISRGTNTGYVYLAQDTTEEYAKYDFYNIVKLQSQQTKDLFMYSYNYSSKHPIAAKLAEYFLEQRNKVLEFQNKISHYIVS
ncbi:hypothetical protein ABPG72_005738 [Tetrahymena utriculariae]